MNFKWIVLFCLVSLAVYAESKKYEQKNYDKHQVENKKNKQYDGKKDANSKLSPNEEIQAESKPTKEKYNKKSKEYQSKSKEYVKDEKKQNKKVKRETVPEQPIEEAIMEQPVIDENAVPDSKVIVEAIETAPEVHVEKKKSKSEPSKKIKNSVKSEKVKQKPEKNIPEVDCPVQEEVHVQSKKCWKNNANKIAEEPVEVAVESA